MEPRLPAAALAAWMTLCAGSPAQAAVLHRCRSEDGAIAWRDLPCLRGEYEVARREVAVPLPAADPPTAQISSPRVPSPPRSSATPPPRRAAGQVVAHECRFGEQRWVQAGACPPRMAQGGARAAVDEVRLTADQVCGALRGATGSQGGAPGSAARAYAMNRLRQRHGC